MTTLEAFTKTAAKRYLQNIVFVDDEIYAHLSGKPAVDTSDLPAFRPPFLSAQSPGEPPKPAATSAIASPESTVPADAALPNKGDDDTDRAVPYHPKQLVESFAREGMVCALYEPAEKFDTAPESELFKLCERADVVILDWDLFHEDGRNILPLIQNLVDQSQSSIPHHSRLCVVYTTKPDLGRVASAIYDHLHNAKLEVQDVQDNTTLVAGATRIIVLGKPDVTGRPAELKHLEVREQDLATRVIEEFARMHSGLLPSYALYGMASVRRNSKKILDKFHSEQDGPFLLHRALLLANEDAFEQLPELVAEEVLAVMMDNQPKPDEACLVAKDAASALKLENVVWPDIPGKKQPEKEALVRSYLGGGADAIPEYKICEKKDRDHPSKLHSSMGCGKTNADKKLAALFSLRTNYFENDRPTLGFGTIVRWFVDGDVAKPLYGLCLMPLCDSLRLKSGDGQTTAFPFWTLKTTNNGGTSRGIVVPTGKDNDYVELFASGKPRDMLWIDRFSPEASGTVVAKNDPEEHGKEKSFFFVGQLKSRLEWVAQLKPSHAQRVAHDIGHSFSRVGVLEAEWLRLKTEGRS